MGQKIFHFQVPSSAAAAHALKMRLSADVQGQLVESAVAIYIRIVLKACAGPLAAVRSSQTPACGQRRSDAGFDGVCQSNQPGFQRLIGSASPEAAPILALRPADSPHPGQRPHARATTKTCTPR